MKRQQFYLLKDAHKDPAYFPEGTNLNNSTSRLAETNESNDYILVRKKERNVSYDELKDKLYQTQFELNQV